VCVCVHHYSYDMLQLIIIAICRETVDKGTFDATTYRHRKWMVIHWRIMWIKCQYLMSTVTEIRLKLHNICIQYMCTVGIQTS